VSGPDAQSRVAALLREPALHALLAVLDGAGEETRVVGGAVRNTLLGHPVHEVDLATTATPDVVGARAEKAGFKAVPTGIEHGTVTVVVDGTPFEVTTLREDVETHGRRATVRFGRDFKADARRRDFTINALSVSRDGRIHDYVGGLADLESRRVRFIGDAAARIREDYLRILRFFRFTAEYGDGSPDEEGFSAAIRERSGVAILSRERVRVEFMKLLVTRRAFDMVRVLSDTGFLALFLAGVGDFGRLARAITDEQQEERGPDALRRLAALAVITPEDAERLRERLRLSNDEHDRLNALARLITRLKSIPDPLDAILIRRLVADHGTALLADALALVSGEPRPVLAAEASQSFARFASGEEAVPVFPFRGADIVARGVAKGPRVGEILARARQAWLTAGCPSEASLDELLADPRGLALTESAK
jgi:poly(A) polymerase